MGSKTSAAVRETMLVHEEMAYMGTLESTWLSEHTRMPDGNGNGAHEQDPNHISLQQWFSVVFPVYLARDKYASMDGELNLGIPYS